MARFKRLVLAGAFHLRDGAQDYESWTERMISEFGPTIKPFLKDVYKWSCKVPAGAAVARVSPEVSGAKESAGEKTVADTSNESRGYAAMSHSILVVDDEPNIVLSIEFLMKQQGYEVRTAGNGQDALRALEEDIPDLVLLDVMMPKPDGFEVCQAIRANPDWKGVTVIMLTAKGREVDREKGLALGADDYITKPFATRELVEKVRSFLRVDAE